jgi:hypothetical protein
MSKSEVKKLVKAFADILKKTVSHLKIFICSVHRQLAKLMSIVILM